MKVISSAALPSPCPIPGREPRTTRIGLVQTRWYDAADAHTEQLREGVSACAGAGANVWFEYVPSAPNSADEPSRVLSLAHGPYSPAPGLRSRPCATRFPQLERLGSASEWIRAARRAAHPHE